MIDMTNANKSPIASYVMPRIARLDKNLYAACFKVMKLLPAKRIIENEILAGRLKKGGKVIESTSGTFGLALAMLAKRYDYSLTLVSDPVIDPLLKRKLEILGVRLEIVKSSGEGGYQRARIARLNEILENEPETVFTNQYNNPVNSDAYDDLAMYLSDKIGRIDYLVGTVGTGGSMCGTAATLKKLFPHIKIVGIDTHNSVIFGHPDGKRILRGLGNSLMPKNINHKVFDEIHWVGAFEAYISANRLFRDKSLFMGGTSGAAFLVSEWIAQNNPDKNIAVIFPDEGYRYQNNVYNQQYIDETFAGIECALMPQKVSYPDEIMSGWTYYDWNRRDLSDVKKVTFPERIDN